MVEMFRESVAQSVPVGTKVTAAGFIVSGYVRLKQALFSSSCNGRFELVINGVPFNVVFNSSASLNINTQLDLHLNSGDQVVVNVTNMDRCSCDYYITLVMEDMREEWNRQFTKELHKELTS